MSSTFLPIAPLKKIIKSLKHPNPQFTGWKPAIGKEALNLYRDEVEKYATQLAEESTKRALMMNRKTVRTHDIEMAALQIIENIGDIYVKELAKQEPEKPEFSVLNRRVQKILETI